MSANMDNIEYKVVSAEEINYPSGSFDAITACQCFWYFDPAVVVPKIRTMLKPDGIFLKDHTGFKFHRKEDQWLMERRILGLEGLVKALFR